MDWTLGSERSYKKNEISDFRFQLFSNLVVNELMEIKIPLSIVRTFRYGDVSYFCLWLPLRQRSHTYGCVLILPILTH